MRSGWTMERKEKLLAVNTGPEIYELLDKLFRNNGEQHIDNVASYAEAEELARDKEYDLVLLNLDQDQGAAIQLLTRIKQICQQTMIIITARNASVESVLASMRKGAYDYITMPFEEEELLLIIEKALENKKLGEARRKTLERLNRERMRNINLQRDIWKAMISDMIDGESAILKPLQDILLDVAQTDSPILIQGEVGTGKGLVARFLHYHSMRRDQPFIEINCAIYSEPVLYSELFGYEKGAYTGAINTRLGRIELANRGTIFLDEIDRLSERIQYMLFKFLEEGQFKKMGGDEPVTSNVRVIAGSNVILEKEAQEQAFREDLFYKLNLIPLHLPPLHERAEDIPLIAMELLKKVHKKYRKEKKVRGFSAKALKTMASYTWPGNIREMENFIERAVLTTKGHMIQVVDLPRNIREASQNISASMPSLYESERRIIINALKRCQGNKKHAARLLQINRSSLYSKIKRFELTEYM